MMTMIENPAPLWDGSRVSELINAVTLDGPENTPVPNPRQADLLAGFDPEAMPILACHWFGLTSHRRENAA